jgi:hypothetical protein
MGSTQRLTPHTAESANPVGVKEGGGEGGVGLKYVGCIVLQDTGEPRGWGREFPLRCGFLEGFW